jgi:NAD(P)-dependent dehydrogenase (short-subunit alcohol dehydrogenase family)
MTLRPVAGGSPSGAHQFRSAEPHVLAYATTKGAIQNFTAGLPQLLAEKDIRVNAVAAWTDLDSAYPVHTACGVRSKLRQAIETARPAG